VSVSLWRRFWITFSAYVIGCYASLLNRLQVKGAQYIPAKGGVLLASNHISAYETIFLPWAVLRSQPFQMVWAPAKEELFRKLIPRLLYSSWGAFPVRRGRDVKAGRVLNDLLADQKVMLFPEGTRHRDGRLGPGNRGVGKVIYDTRPVVIPTALIGLNQWSFPSLGAKGAIVFGPPLVFDDLFALENNKETHQLIVERVMEGIAQVLKQEGAYVGRVEK
jgi:1-acyl-sn-glycerol-3-phosphate acyltransferase